MSVLVHADDQTLGRVCEITCDPTTNRVRTMEVRSTNEILGRDGTFGSASTCTKREARCKKTVQSCIFNPHEVAEALIERSFVRCAWLLCARDQCSTGAQELADECIISTFSDRRFFANPDFQVPANKTAKAPNREVIHNNKTWNSTAILAVPASVPLLVKSVDRVSCTSFLARPGTPEHGWSGERSADDTALSQLAEDVLWDIQVAEVPKEQRSEASL